MLVITNSRKFAHRKLLAKRVRPPMEHINFITTLSDLEHATRSLSRSLPSLLLWQRGRLSDDQRLLRDRVEVLFSEGRLRSANQKEILNET